MTEDFPELLAQLKMEEQRLAMKKGRMLFLRVMSVYRTTRNLCEFK
jgi:hypothetical protein